MANQVQVRLAEKLLTLHRGPEVLVLANVWDAASARIVEDAGFPAVATSSAGIAFARGYPDGQNITRTEMLSAVERIAAATALPVTADLEAGYGSGASDAAETARGLIASGAVGLNFEDATGDPANPLFDVRVQAERIRSIRAVAAEEGVPVVVNARTDVYLLGVGDPADRLEHTVRRVNAYRAAGADCLFVPGVRDRSTIAALAKSVNGPLNILAGTGMPSIKELHDLGVARVSFGSWPARASYGLFRRFARELREKNTFSTLDDFAISYQSMNGLFEAKTQ